MDITQLLTYGNVMIVGFCLCVGWIIKELIPTDRVNRYIPLIMGVMGVLLALWIYGAATPDTVFTGLFSGLASTGAYEAFRNLVGNIFKEEKGE